MTSSSELREDDILLELEAVCPPTSAIGTVAAAGERATVLLGKRVLVGPIDPCGECEVCRRGGGPVCPLAQRRTFDASTRRITAGARWVVALDDGLALPAPGGAAVAGPIALAYTIYARTGIGPREPVVIAGASPVARFLIEVLRAKGIAPAVVVDPAHGAWAEWLLGKGVTVARTTSVADARATCIAAFDAEGLGGRPWRVIAVTEDAAPLAAALAGPRATLTVVSPVGALPGDLAAREVTVIGVAGAHPDLVVEVAAMCVKGEIDLAGGTAAAPTPDHRAVVISG